MAKKKCSAGFILIDGRCIPSKSACKSLYKALSPRGNASGKVGHNVFVKHGRIGDYSGVSCLDIIITMPEETDYQYMAIMKSEGVPLREDRYLCTRIVDNWEQLGKEIQRIKDEELFD